MVGILITNGGPHPSDVWAAETARQICDLVQISDASSSPEAIAARKAKPKLQVALADMLEGFHAKVQGYEREKLAAEGEGRLVAPLDPNDGVIDTIDEAVGAVVTAAKATPFAAHFASDAVKAVVRQTIEQHFAMSMDIERSWHADLNPDSETVKAYRKARADHGYRLAHQFIDPAIRARHTPAAKKRA